MVAGLEEMIKVRLTYVDTEKGVKEFETLLQHLEEKGEILQISRPYSQRGNSKYKSVYVDIEIES